MQRHFSYLRLLVLMMLFSLLLQVTAQDIISIAPNSMTAGQQPSTITISGTGFTNATTVDIVGYSGAQTVTFIDASTLEVTIQDSIAVATYDISITEGGVTDTLTTALTVSAPPQITVTSSTPSQLVSGQSTTMTINGNNFTMNAIVELVASGGAVTPITPVTFVNAGQLTVTVPNTLAADMYTVRVRDADTLIGTDDSPNMLEVLAPTPIPQITVSSSEPSSMVRGQTMNISIFGSNFTQDTTVRLVGFGLLTTTFVNQNSLLASVPTTVPAGVYTLRMSDPIRGSQDLSDAFRVLAPTALPQPTALPTATLTPLPTRAPSTPVPGQPTLIISSYIATPSTVPQGGLVSFSVTVINQGNRTAESVSASLAPGGSLIPSGSQTSILLPNIFPGNSYTFTLNAMVASDAPGGTNDVTLNIDYRDFQNTAYSAQSTLSVDVDMVVLMSRLSLNSYIVSPDPLQPGSAVDVEVFITNTGTEIASQVQLTVPVGNGVLLAGPQGNVFSLGNIAPGVEVSRTLPLIVSSTAQAGVQSQPLNLSYIQDGNTQQSDLFMTLTVDTPLSSSILLESYDIGQESVQPGERFTLDATLINIGEVAVEEALVTFTLAPTASNNNNGNGNNPTTNTIFAPIGGGGSIFLGNIEADGESTFAQEFIVNASVESGIYTLPIIVNYLNPDGTTTEETLNASVVVLVPPFLRFIEEVNIPSVARIGDTVTLQLNIQNSGRRDVDLLSARLVADAFDILSDEEILLDTLRPSDQIFFEGQLVPFFEGEQVIRLELTYLNDLNQETIYVQEYPMTILPAPPPPPTRIPTTPIPSELVTADEPQGFVIPDDFWGRLLLGLLGLGS